MKTFVIKSKTYGDSNIYYDDEDEPLIIGHLWHIQRNSNRHHEMYYAKANLKSVGKRTTIFFHRLVLGITDSRIRVDHKNHNGLDNQKDNLRTANASLNGANARSVNKTSRFKGIRFDTDQIRPKPWRAAIRVNQKQKYLGRYATEEEAALAYNKAAVEYFGEFALINILP